MENTHPHTDMRIETSNWVHNGFPKKFLLINGPPRSGKDTLADLLQERRGFTSLKFATPLRTAVPAMFGIPQHIYDILIEQHKESPTELLQGMSPREAQIWLSEEVMKPRFGQFIFGQILAGTANHSVNNKFVVSDSGFLTEAQVLVDTFGHENVKLIRLHRKGTSFAGDSRSYVAVDGVESIDIFNNGTLEELLAAALGFIGNVYA